MANKSLVVVESPAKARTISKILGKDFSVVSSMGHVIDLPKKKLGVDIEAGFVPDYVVIPGRKSLITTLKKESKDKDTIYVATDPDREGEAIGWQLKDKVFKKKNCQRVSFHEITASAIKEAFKNPRDFDMNMVQAQTGRRVLDRIVGYFLSPLLWKKIGRGLSAGRVQSVALRLVVDREKEIKAFVPQEYWEIEAKFDSFTAKLEKKDDKKIEIKNKEEADRIVEDIKPKQFIVSQIKKSEKKRNAYAPFITSTLQQEAFNKLRYNAQKTMIVAQQLYEGIDVGEEAPVGLITYMRTDSTRSAPEAIKEVRAYIGKTYGKDYLPDEPNVYKVRKLAQEAHEAIRPTFISRPPQSLKEFLSSEQYELYELIYNRFVSSQMTPARFAAVSVDIKADNYLLSASGSEIIFDGFQRCYNKDNGESEEPEAEKAKNIIPELIEGQNLELSRLIPSQHFTKPKPRFSDSSLVKALEENGIGRPSTYAPIIQTLILRDYIRRIKGYFHASELGFKVCDLLVEYFPKIMDVSFTAGMEEKLDDIEEGKADKVQILSEFYEPFKISLDYALEFVKKEVIITNEVCATCGKPMIVKWGRRGKFLSCSGFPECKVSKSITSGIKCPEASCGGELIERHSRRGVFYGCSNFPKCTFTSRELPEVSPPQVIGNK